MPGIIACATLAKNMINQDGCSTFYNKKLNIRGVIVADGLGSHAFSEVAANSVASFIGEYLSNLKKINKLDFVKIFSDARVNLISECKRNIEYVEHLSSLNALSTTVICAVETGTEFIVAYVGNGSIWNIRGDFNQFGPQRYLPWNAINILNPHSIEEGGKNALYKYISVANVDCIPTIVKMSKDQVQAGEIIMISTDGIYSYDQVIIGKDEEQTVWISGQKQMQLFFQHLARFFEKTKLSLTDETLTFELEAYLNELKEGGLLEDDSTIGLIIPQNVLNFQSKINYERN